MKKSLLMLLAVLCISYSQPNLNQTVFAQTKKQAKKEITVYITKTGAKYHQGYCSYLRKSSIPIGKSSAVSSGYTACSRCNP